MINLQELVTNDLIVEVIKSENQLKRIRESHSGLIPGYPTLDGLDSTINTPRTCLFSDEDGTTKSFKNQQQLTTLNLLDMWKAPLAGSAASQLQIGDRLTAQGLSIQLGDQFMDSSRSFGMFSLPYLSSPIDSEAEEWLHSRMSSCETDLTVVSNDDAAVLML
ncbi:hypothetical protein PGT21_001107 [Puccinia graminis f. sp. tritici]|uniref:Uncharacterized protein n=1 Tax=Puccinia graminis f. sp. tritici TaxID=56615 RepID=A0A5B0QE86_PUCGR|nr:hypothetical protein PGT21_001107 [Puccinia graminis f. sp. tritici]